MSGDGIKVDYQLADHAAGELAQVLSRIATNIHFLEQQRKTINDMFTGLGGDANTTLQTKFNNDLTSYHQAFDQLKAAIQSHAGHGGTFWETDKAMAARFANIKA